MNYATTTSSTYENNIEKVEYIKKLNEKINELFLIIQEKEHEIDCLKQHISYYKELQNELNVSQHNYFEMKNKFETCQKCLIESENKYNEILQKFNNMTITLKNFSESYKTFQNQKDEFNKLKNDNNRLLKELNQKNNRIEFLIGRDKINSEKMILVQEKENKNKEKINKLKLKIKELTTLNEDVVNQKNKYENDLKNNINKLNQLMNIIENNNLTFDKSLFINKSQNIDNQLNNLTNENSNLSKINIQSQKKIEELNKEKEDFQNMINNLIQEYSQEMSSLITLIKNNFDLIKTGNINDIKHIIPSNNIKEKFSLINILPFQNLIDLYDELININSTLQNNINSYANITIRDLKELKNKNRRYEQEINNLKNELNIIQKSQNEIEEKSKQNNMEIELKTNQLKENNEKLEIQLNSILSLINESYKKITKEYNIISTTEEFPENLKILNLQNNNIKEMIMDYEKILNNLTQYTKILINDKKRLFKLGEKSDECEKDLLLIKQELEDLKQSNFQNINNSKSKSNNDINSKNEEIISLTKKLNEKTDDFEKLNSNYNLLYTQYHILLAKDNIKNSKNTNLQSKNILHY